MRIEGPAKADGSARYASDMRLPGQLYARILRSPLPHARILRIDTTRAAGLPGIRAVLSSIDAPDISWYGESRLFDRTVRFVGDEVAAVAAESNDIAEDALRRIEIEYEPLPFSSGIDDGRRGEPAVKSRGDIERGLGEAELVIDQTYSTQAALHNALEPHGCTASWDGDTLTLYESTQGIFAVRSEVAKKLGLPETRVRVVTEHMGGGFGAKQIAWKHSVIAALLSKRAGRPVQLFLDRESENLAVGHRNATRQRVRLGAKRDGTLTAIDVHALVQAGAYVPGGEDSDVSGIYHTLYRCANVRTEQITVRTNTGPAVAFRAPGHAEADFALESAMDELARALAMDAVELRLKNYATGNQAKKKPYTSPESLKRCYALVRNALQPGHVRSAGPHKRRGVGFAAHDWPGGSGWPPGEARVRLEGKDRARVITATQDIGTGTRTGLARIAAEALDLPADQVSVTLGDTKEELYSPSSAGSATLATLGPAVRRAALAARASGGSGSGERSENPKDRSIRTCGAQAVEVEIDTETGEIRVLRVAAAHDCGRIIDPVLVESQVIGGITQGLGYALTEERIMDRARGLVLNANLEEYKLQTVADLAEIVNLTESMPDWEANETGAKGIGEPPIIPTAAAVANAIFDAIGVRIRDLPCRRERLLR